MMKDVAKYIDDKLKQSENGKEYIENYTALYSVMLLHYRLAKESVKSAVSEQEKKETRSILEAMETVHEKTHKILGMLIDEFLKEKTV